MNRRGACILYTYLVTTAFVMSCSTITLEPHEQQHPTDSEACNQWASVTQKEEPATARPQPTRQAKPTTSLPAGTRVQLQHSENGWLKTEHGWIFGTQLSVEVEGKPLHVTPDITSPKTGVGNGTAFVVKCTQGWLYVVFDKKPGKKTRGWLHTEKLSPEPE